MRCCTSINAPVHKYHKHWCRGTAPFYIAQWQLCTSYICVWPLVIQIHIHQFGLPVVWAIKLICEPPLCCAELLVSLLLCSLPPPPSTATQASDRHCTHTHTKLLRYLPYLCLNTNLLQTNIYYHKARFMVWC